MKFYQTLCCTLAVSFCVAMSVSGNHDNWEEFKKVHHKTYDTPEIEKIRRNIFLENVEKIEKHNELYYKGLRSFSLEIKPHSDLTMGEVRKQGLTTERILPSAARIGTPKPVQFAASGRPLPKFVDWREKGIISPVTAQLRCLACWAFAATDAIQSQYALKYDKHLLLSQQQMVDCSWEEGDLGCRGGMVNWAYQYTMRSGGLELASDYPYENRNGECRFNETKIAASITNYGEIKNGSEVSLQEAVAFYGPVSVSIDSYSFEWNYYKKGIFNNPDCTTDVDHAVLVVGYGTENGTDYWLVKNSYGIKFGDKGYIKMSRNKNNQCAIASYANFPIIGEWDPKKY